jgi:hypothetical protein
MPELILAILVLGALFSMPLISGLFARSQGRSFLAWFLIGCLLPFISVFVLFFLPDKQDHPQQP